MPGRQAKPAWYFCEKMRHAPFSLFRFAVFAVAHGGRQASPTLHQTSGVSATLA
jgi:hypothetical protein